MKPIKVVLTTHLASMKPKDRVNSKYGPNITHKLVVKHNLHAAKNMTAILQFLRENGWVTADRIHRHMCEIGLMSDSSTVDGVTATIRDLRKCGYYVPLAKCTFKTGVTRSSYRLRGWSEYREKDHAKRVDIVRRSVYKSLSKPDLIVLLERMNKKISRSLESS